MRSYVVLAGVVAYLMLSGCGGGGDSEPSIPPGTFTLTPGSVQFEALEDGDLPASKALSVNVTGPQVASIGVSYAGGLTRPDWLGIHVIGSGATHTVLLSVLSTALVPGQYSSSLIVSTADGGGKILQSRSVEVQFVVSARPFEISRLNVGATGVGFLSAPDRSVLTRKVTVFSSIERDDIPWRAATAQPWLAITPSGVTGDAVTLTASPAGLEADRTHFAIVQVTSTHPGVQNQQEILVGLHIRSEPVTDHHFEMPAQFLVASPVEPIVFVNDGGPSIVGHNVHSGVIVRYFQDVVASAGPMVMSGDGLRLFVYDRTSLNVEEFDAITHQHVRTYESGTHDGQPHYDGGMAYLRPSGHPMLITPSARIYDASNGTELDIADFTAPMFAHNLAASPDSSRLVTTAGDIFRVARTGLDGSKVSAELQFAAAVPGIGQACVSADGTTMYTANGAPHAFPGTSLSTGQISQWLQATTYPQSVVCVWNGLVVGGIENQYQPTDIYAFHAPTGTLLGQLKSGKVTSVLEYRGLAVSADGSRIVSISGDFNSRSPLAREYRIQSLPSPP